MVHIPSEIAVAFEPEELAQLVEYTDHLIHWNKKFSFTAIPDEEIFQRLIAPSAWYGKRFEKEKVKVVADFGSGVGIPGIPMALMNKSAKYILIETNGKKAGFIEHCLLAMGISNTTLLKVRFDQKTIIDLPDRIVGRASGSMVEVLTLFQGRMAVGAMGGFFKGSDASKEIGELAAWRGESQGEVIKTPDWFGDLCIVEVTNIAS